MDVMSTPQNQPTTIALIRHGQTDWNALGRFQGSSDTLLNDHGRAQAHEAADWLAAECADIEWDAVRYSPLKRATETAAIIGERLSVAMGAPLPALVERDWGSAEALTNEQIYARWPQTHTPENIHIGRNRIPGVEPLDLMLARGQFALSTLAAQYPGRNVIATSHGTLIRFTLNHLLPEPLGYIPNVGVTLLRSWADSVTPRIELIDASFDLKLPEPGSDAIASLAYEGV